MGRAEPTGLRRPRRCALKPLSARETAFSLLELVVSVTALTFIFGIVFLLLSYGVGGFSLLQTRQSLQSSALRCRLRLERDLGLSHYDSLATLQRGSANSEDALGMLGLSSWNLESSYSSDGLPLWNRQIVYSAERSPAGKLSLLRTEFEPAPPAGYTYLPVRPIPREILSAAGTLSPPSALGLVRRETMVEELEGFKCQLDASRQLAQITLRQRQSGGVRPAGSQRTEETFEAVFEIDPLNTSPRL